jgi:hypothetical protein
MIASFSRNFVFIKTRKTGGTSVEIVLSSWCSGRDVCTPMTAEDEITRRLYGGRVMNFGAGFWQERAYLRAIKSADTDRIESAYGTLRKRFYHHMPATEVRTMLPDLWQRAFTFTVERHPYERAVSRAYWNMARKGGDFSRALDEALDRGELPNYPLYMENGKLLLDAVIPYERLWTEIEEMSRKLRARFPNSLPRAKSNCRLDHRSGHEILSRAQKARIAEQCAPEFTLMGYRD